MDIFYHSFKSFPAASDRVAWKKCATAPGNQELITNINKVAQKAMTTPVPPCSMAKFMKYNRNGNRIDYENEYFERRARLQALALAEALEYEGKYIDMIIEYLCAISAEYTWAIPAHTAQKDVLPYCELEIIDLFSAETSNTITQVLSLLEQELGKVSPNLVKRLKKQLEERAVIPVETALETYWWRNLVSNWNPWICSNLLWTANYVLAGDPPRLTAFADKLTTVTDRYYNAYSEDGGSEEGTTYWTVSPVTYFLYCEALYRMSDGKWSRFGDDKFKRMCEYIAAPQAGDNEFVTFADASKKISLPVGICRIMAQRLNSDVLRKIASAPKAVTNTPRTSYGGLDTLYALFNPMDDPSKVQAVDFLMVYPKLEQLYCRRGNGYFAVKAGNNGENHGHLDCGQFVFRQNGKFPVLDLGAPEYSKDTFNENRFKNFIMNAEGHNPLRFNGIGQGNGKEFTAREFAYEEVDGKVIVTIELAGCYPAELGLESYTRKLIFDGGTVTLRDEYKAAKELTPEMTIFSEVENPVLKSNLPVKSEKFKLEDNKLKANWGSELTRLTVSGVPAKSGTVELTFGLKK